MIFFASLFNCIAQERATTGEKAETKAAEKKSLPEQLIGHWIVDEKALLKKMRAAAEKSSKDELTPEIESL